MKGKVDNPEAAAIDKISSDIADLLQGSIIQFATRANSKKLLSDEQKNAAFPQSQHETHYTAKLLDIVANTIKMDDEDQKFEAFLTILRHDLGGPLITLSHKMSKDLHSDMHICSINIDMCCQLVPVFMGMGPFLIFVFSFVEEEKLRRQRQLTT